MARVPKRNRAQNLPIYSGVLAAVCLSVPVSLWAQDEAECTAFDRVAALGIVAAGLVIAVAALPVGLWMMLGRHEARWLAVPIGLVGLATLVVGYSQMGAQGPCPNQSSLTVLVGTLAFLGGFGLLGLAAALLRRTRVSS
jgi:hypothetical protein